MRPEIIVHNTIGLDGSVTGFGVDMELHYRLAGAIGADGHLVGSRTAKTGMELFLEEIPPEAEQDREPGAGDGPLWVVPDSGGLLEGLLHVLRSSPYCREVLVLVSERTPASYRRYLDERSYPVIQVGSGQVDLSRGLEAVAERGVRRMMVDAGPGLVGALLDRGLIDELSLLVAPAVVGSGALPLLGAVERPVTLELLECRPEQGGAVHLRYKASGIAEPAT